MDSGLSSIAYYYGIDGALGLFVVHIKGQKVYPKTVHVISFTSFSERISIQSF